jgi:hypothetical protein
MQHSKVEVAQRSEAELNREHMVMLEELRVALPGMQMLFAFLLSIPFAKGFESTTALQRGVFSTDLLATTLSSIFLIAPAVYHRLHWRRDVADKDQMLKVINRLAIVGGAFLSVAITASIFLIIDYLFGPRAALFSSLSIAAICGAVWYGLPLLRRSREHRQH